MISYEVLQPREYFSSHGWAVSNRGTHPRHSIIAIRMAAVVVGVHSPAFILEMERQSPVVAASRSPRLGNNDLRLCLYLHL